MLADNCSLSGTIVMMTLRWWGGGGGGGGGGTTDNNRLKHTYQINSASINVMTHSNHPLLFP